MKGYKLSDFDPALLGPTAAQGMAKLAKEFAEATHQVSGTPLADSATKLVEIPHPRITLAIDLPGVIVRSEANIGGRLKDRLARKSAVKDQVTLALLASPVPPKGPWRVLLTRLGGKKLDDDNLDHAFKAVRDCVANWLGCDDGDESKVRWSYKQRPSYRAGIRIEVRA